MVSIGFLPKYFASTLFEQAGLGPLVTMFCRKELRDRHCKAESRELCAGVLP